MTKLRPALLALALVLPAAVSAEEPQPVLTMQDVLDQSKPGDWRTLDPENTLYVELDSGRVVIELAPAFAPRHVANIRTLVRAGYFDGLSINRSQDNFVVQWGDADSGDKDKVRSLGDADGQLPAEFVRAAEGITVPDIWAPYYLEGTFTSGQFLNDVGNAAYSIDLAELEPYPVMEP